MSSFFTRFFSAIFIVFGGQALADIPMVTTAMIPSPKLIIPHLPIHPAQVFNRHPVAASYLADVLQRIDVSGQANISAFGTPCTITTTAKASANAMITVRVLAPCLPHASLEVFDGTLMHTALISLTGTAELTIPAMSASVDLAMILDENVSTHTIELADFNNFARIALMASNQVELAATHLGREMEIYKTEGLQVFSVDLREADKSRLYRMILRREITQTNCTGPQDVVLHRFVPGRAPQKQALRLVAANCTRVGDILELKNIVPDLRIASN